MVSRIVYVDKTSLVDWDGMIVATIFLCGCNFRCWYCHNKDLVVCKGDGIDLKQVIEFLERRKDLLDGVVITGGEPLLDKDIVHIARAIKRIGYKVKIDTNGSRPDLLKVLIDNGLVDYVAMDVKWYFDRYEEVVGVKVDQEKLYSSVEIIKSSGIDYEFRTTVIEWMDKRTIIDIAKQVAPAKRYVLQLQRHNGKICVDVDVVRSAVEELKRYGWFDSVKVRGMEV